MHSDVSRDLQRRLQLLERRMPRLRFGVVTATSPLTVALGGSAVAYTNCQRIGGAPAVDDLVAVLVCDGNLLVLGTVQ